VRDQVLGDEEIERSLVVREAAGRDTLVGQGGNDVLNGKDDGDKLLGGLGNDRFTAAKAGTCSREAGADKLIGAADNDSFFAKDGEIDLLNGGSGKDRGEWDKTDSRKLMP
jgi:Ca2+-binding RTX toxin-like protein